MTDGPDATTREQSSDESPASRRPVSVAYVAATTRCSHSVPSLLRDEHGLEVTEVPSFEVAAGQTQKDDAVDCIVCPAGEQSGVDPGRIDRQFEPQLLPPVVLLVEPGRRALVRRAVRRDWVDDVVVRATDTEDMTLLAHRLERCAAHHRQHATARRLQSALDRINRGVALATPDGRVHYVNPAFETLGGGPETVRAESLARLASSIPDDSAARAFRDAVTAGEACAREFTADGDGGGTRSMRLTTNPIHSDDGDVRCVLVLLDDVTDRRHRERDRRWFRQAVDHAGHAIMLTDVDGTIEYVNPAFEETTGYAAGEALGERPSILKSGEHDDEFYRDLWETILAGDVWQGEVTNRRKGGERYQVNQTVAPIYGNDGDGDIEGFVAVNIDITDRKRHEAQLERERDRLEEFAKTVSHDLRNPLAIALGHAELARQQTADDDADVAEILDTTLGALERIDTVVDEVRTLSRQGETIHDPERVRVDRVVETAWRHVATADATLSAADELSGYTVSADSARLRELLENLVRNAVEHAGPDVTVGVGRLDDGDGFYVEDDGPGLPATDYGRVFESGFTTSDSGTGFGLAIVRQIAEAHGWTVTAADAVASDGGARFEIYTAASPSRDSRQP